MNTLYLLKSHEGSSNWVFLHGWGSDQSLWTEFRGMLGKRFCGSHYVVDLPGFGRQQDSDLIGFEAYISNLGEGLPDDCILVGWSLGGMLATQLTLQFPDKIKALITLACNPCFIQRDHWPYAMLKQTFEQFQQSFTVSPKKTWMRFCSLQVQGSDKPRELLKALKQQQPPEDLSLANWQQGLQWLGEIDNRAALQSLCVPNLHVLGEGDSLVPSLVAKHIARLGRAEIACIDGAGHCLHLSQPEQTLDSVCEWLEARGICESVESDEVIDKSKIARSFGLAAKTYDTAASLQKSVAQSLLSFGSHFIVRPESQSSSVLDLGCGTGFIAQMLSNHSRLNGELSLTLLDLAEPMVGCAKGKLLGINGVEKVFNGVCADAESLPFTVDSFDAVVSSLAVQWCANLTVVGEEVSRVLKQDGYFLFSTLGPKTLLELKQSWARINDFVHVNHFKSFDAVKSEIEQAGFMVEQRQLFTEVMHYTEVLPILRDLKLIGAHNMNVGQNPGLTSVRQMKAFGQEYERFRTQTGSLPVTYEVIMVLAKKK